MSDSHATYIHMNQPWIVDHLDEWLQQKLPVEDIWVPPEHQPMNPEDEDEVPDQHAAAGLLRAQKPPEPAWRDLGLREMAARGPKQGEDVKKVESLRKKIPLPR
ncbi:hypothetical protein SAICODRAFT_64328 [Saitoella complicata NRRL Y-17804]|uniref:Uncharacterized protein n=1 Tax=Saitoella complicata (strain BCRC 22490 / CBS 7301 / JCM 7358 / NBRC 10748 / NRRL Y-17804) TaxID=698492 RepID=A0A0E9NJI6_SAICN|nr:uncharacterized protein SAICODRAFT_64328 [Saitoella complicata NRRL Y-17804]ODQ55099.1 hypothetical protein SAICODRAFT_64328 [Saitoella complicata NRRL Y-17804]GAO50037.1 hypothetical protein G7K_4172-t1 [Saitoella complicata NRRL Y-17804]